MMSKDSGSLEVTEAQQENENVSFLYDLASAPCFRQSTLYGIGGGAAIGALSFLRNRNLMRSTETMVKAGVSISLLTWVICRRNYYLQRELAYESLQRYRQQSAARAAAQAREMREKNSASNIGLIIRFLMVLTRRAAKEAAEKAAAAGDNPATSPIDISEMSTSQQIDIEEQFQKSNNDDHSSSKEPLTAPGQHDGDDDDDNSNQFAVEQPSDPEKLYARKMPEPAAKTELGTHSHEGEIEENVEPVEEDVESSEESLRLEGPTDQKCIVSPADTAPKSFESRQAVSMRLRVGHALAFIAVTVTAHAASSRTINPLPVHALVILACIVPLRLVLAITLHGRFAPGLMPRLSLALKGPFLFASNALHLIASRVDQKSLPTYLVASASQIAAAWFSITVTTSQPLGHHFIIVHSLFDTAADIFLASVVSGRAALQQSFRPLFWVRIVTDLVRITSSVAVIIRHDEADKRYDLNNKSHAS